MGYLPKVARLQLDGTAIKDFDIKEPMRILYISPATSTVTLQYAFEAGKANTAGKFGELLSGSPLNLEAIGGDNIEPLTLSLFAGAALTVYVVYG